MGSTGRERPGRGHYGLPVVEVDADTFEEYVTLALEGIPEKLASYIDNVVVFVADKSPRPGLLGLYEGIPLTKRGNDYGGLVMPDRITIFRDAICRVCKSEDEVVEQVRVTVVHEVAHHFGISDKRLEELGWG